MDQSSYQTPLHEPIDVDATFSRNFLGHCQPICFRTSSGREVLISEIGLVHPRYDGLKTTFAFDITDGVERLPHYTRQRIAQLVSRV